jgi:hypothetical protein
MCSISCNDTPRTSSGVEAPPIEEATQAKSDAISQSATPLAKSSSIIRPRRLTGSHPLSTEFHREASHRWLVRQTSNPVEYRGRSTPPSAQSFFREYLFRPTSLLRPS